MYRLTQTSEIHRIRILTKTACALCLTNKQQHVEEVSSDIAEAILEAEAIQDAEDAPAAAAGDPAAGEPPPRAQRSIDFTAAAMIIDAEATE